MGLESADEIDAAYNDFENEAKREEIVAFAHTEEIDPTMLTDFISNINFPAQWMPGRFSRPYRKTNAAAEKTLSGEQNCRLYPAAHRKISIRRM